MSADDTPTDAVAACASDPFAVLDEVPRTESLSAAEAQYVAAARSANTLRGYTSDWREFTTWCAANDQPAFPASPQAISTYLTVLAGHGAKVGTMSRRLSAIRFAHQLRNLPDPCEHARVVSVWEGIRRVHGAPPVQAKPLMPPELFQVLDACPTMKTWADKTRPEEPHLGGLRDRAILLIGFIGAMRRSELSALDVAHVTEHANGLVLSIPRSKTNQYGDQEELIVLPRAGNSRHCAVTALQAWTDAASIKEGALLRPVSKGNRPLSRRLTEGAVNTLITGAIRRAGIDSAGYSAHSLRAGFVTYAHLRGASDRAIAHQTRHRSLATLDGYVRVDNAWTNNAVTQLGL